MESTAPIPSSRLVRRGGVGLAGAHRTASQEAVQSTPRPNRSRLEQRQLEELEAHVLVAFGSSRSLWPR